MKNNRLWIFAVVLGLFVLGGGAYLSNQGFVVVEEEIWLPAYTSIACSERPESMSNTDLGSIDRRGEFYRCTPQATGYYFPTDVSGVECEYYVVSFLGHSAYVCPLSVTDVDDVKDDCVRAQAGIGTFLTNNQEYRYYVDAGEQLFVNPLGNAEITAKIPSYGLDVIGENGYRYAVTNNCALSSITRVDSASGDVHLVEAVNDEFVSPLSPVNAVTGMQRGTSTRLVRLSDVAGGDLIYITAPNYYYPVAEAEDGWLYVDTRAGEKFNENIECIPLLVGCDEDAKVIPLEEQTVTEGGLGVLTGYAPVTGDSGQLCRYEVVDNQLVVSDDCIVVQDCPDSAPFWNANTGECESQQIEPEKEPEQDNFFLFLMVVISAVLLVVIVMLIIAQQQNKKKK